MDAAERARRSDRDLVADRCRRRLRSRTAPCSPRPSPTRTAPSGSRRPRRAARGCRRRAAEGARAGAARGGARPRAASSSSGTAAGSIVATTVPAPHRPGSSSTTSRTCLRAIAEPGEEPSPRPEAATAEEDGRRCVGCSRSLAARRRLAPLPARAGAAAPGARAASTTTDGSMVTLERDGTRRETAARRSPATRCRTHDELGAQLREHALLEGDFVLRSGRRSTLLPRQVPLRDAARAARPARRAARRGRAASSSPARSGSPGRRSAPSRSPPRPRSRPACRS